VIKNTVISSFVQVTWICLIFQVKAVVYDRQTSKNCQNKQQLSNLVAMLSEPQVGSEENKNATALNYAKEVS